MINFDLRITNPFVKQQDSIIRNATWFHRIPWERSVELEIGNISPGSLIDISLSSDFKGYDHAGPSLELSLFGYGFIIEFQKGRHWNYKKDCWLENYDVWMKKTSVLFEEEFPDDEFLDYLFQEYYEDGNTPEEAIKLYYTDSKFETV